MDMTHPSNHSTRKRCVKNQPSMLKVGMYCNLTSLTCQLPSAAIQPASLENDPTSDKHMVKACESSPWLHCSIMQYHAVSIYPIHQ